MGEIKPPRTDRTIVTGSDSFDDYLAKVHCLRNAFAQLFARPEVRNRYTKIGEDILKIILEHTVRVRKQGEVFEIVFINKMSSSF